MTVSSTNLVDIYDGDDSTRDWPITFPVTGLTDTDIEFYVSVGGISTLVTTGVEVDLTTPKVIYPTVASGLDVLASDPLQKAVVRRTLPLKQEQIDVEDQGAIPLTSIETGFDRITEMCQQIQEEVDRSVKVDLTGDDPDDLIAAITQAKVDAEEAAADAEAQVVLCEAEVVNCQDEVALCEAEVVNCQDEVVLAAAQVTLAAAQVTLAAAQVTLAEAQTALCIAQRVLCESEASDASDSADAAAASAASVPTFTRDTFDNADLSSGVLTITHSLGLSAPFTINIEVFDNNDNKIIPDEITGLTNTIEIDLTSYGTITGNYGYAYLVG